MNALELLRAQHAELDDLLTGIERAPNTEDKVDRFVELADKLATHLEVEACLFYPFLTQRTDDALVEHYVLKHLLDRLHELDATSRAFDVMLEALVDQVQSHVATDERLFAGTLFDDDALIELGNAMQLAFDVVLSTTCHEERRTALPSAA